MATGEEQVIRFIRKLQWEDVPPTVQEQVKHCALDVLGAIIAGSSTKVGQIIADHVESFWPGDGASIILRGKKASVPGATLANSFMANALDIDDGYRLIKGHPGATVLPAILATAEQRHISGKEFLTALLIGYEMAIRGGIAWHAYHAEYHGSGSWGSLGAAAGAARAMGLTAEQTIQALGTAEYHAPISEMMRCIDVPAMTKDGIGWGSMVGVVSALLAEQGFTGIGSIFGMEPFRELVGSLGNEFKIMGLYFKPYSCCRWAQPAVWAALQLRSQYGFVAQEVRCVKISTFKSATRLARNLPETTEEAQYSITYPVSAALVAGEVGPGQVLEENLANPEINRIVSLVEVAFDERFEKEFPAQCMCELEIKLSNGQVYNSGPVAALGDPDHPLGNAGLENKFRWLAGYVLDRESVEAIVAGVLGLEKAKDVATLLSVLGYIKNEKTSHQ
ncbi:MmgE/PrpD family [Acididesulfobacillus acetoxydans]|uniref:MmgE/PrpD family n=1 Tax=Acididesulfobacillus acetoxydans TaxID=1561005 RepID=A0A8S0X7F0_9FIRM|nr:MmgE/PrpD family protein [Acididesulfobacillus acetoxydans]CAA7603260.1 MmgE/PrpD family [Acididesulfobacillus acetoxydans]CEJ07239.1 MmgE/PrpD protein [Acididesulfobacillus acetoxydans]